MLSIEFRRKFLKKLVILTFFFLSIEFIGDGFFSVYRLTILPMSILGIFFCIGLEKRNKYYGVAIGFTMYLVYFFICRIYSDDSNPFFTLMVIPLLLFLFSCWYLKDPIVVDYSKIFIWYFLPHLLALLLGIANFDDGRFAGLHEDPNFCALYINFSVFSALFLIIRDKKLLHKFLYGIILIICLILLFITGSRGAMISLTLICSILLFIHAKIRLSTKFLLLIVFGIITVGLVAYINNLPDWVSPDESLIDYALCRFKPESMASGSGRTEIWSTVFNRIEREGAYFYPIGRTIAMRGLENDYTHNTFVDFCVEEGLIPGTISVLCIFILALKGCFTQKTTFNFECFICSIGVLLQLFFLSSISLKIFWVCLFFIVFISDKSHKNNKNGIINSYTRI